MNTKTLSIIVLSGLIIISFVVLAACSPITGVPVVLAQPDTVETSHIEEDTFLRWEIDANDIAAAREAAHYLAAVQRVSHEISAANISAAHQAAMSLSKFNAVEKVDFDYAELVSGELDAMDISAAREAAHYLEVAQLVSHEISLADISATRQAAQTLNKMLMAGRRILEDLAQRMPAD